VIGTGSYLQTST